MSTDSEYSRLLEEDRIHKLLASDGGLEILLERLKQSLVTGEEFSKFIKKKAIIEDDHYNQMKKFAGNMTAGLKQSNKIKNDSFSSNFSKIVEIDEKLYNVGSSYVKALNSSYDELNALMATVMRSRKNIKDETKKKEKECLDSVMAAEKAKQKYYHFCEDLEKLKSSDPNKKSFSLKNKSAEQQEDDLQRKVDLADQDYRLKVNTCKKLKDELLMIFRPQNGKRLKQLVLEMDIAMNVQLQKYATWSETLIINSGIVISPLKQEGSQKTSMKALASSVDNERDLYSYLIKHEKQPVNKALQPVEYKVHPSLAKTPRINKPFLQNSSNQASSTERDASKSRDASVGSINTNPKPPFQSANSSKSQSETPSEGKSDTKIQGNSLDPGSYAASPTLEGPKSLYSQLKQTSQPTFGVSIEHLIQYAGVDNVPLIVRRCIEIVENYGLEIEGIYRTSGNATTVQNLKDSIDQNYTNYLLIGDDIDPNHVKDSEVYCVASLLKNYFSSLPEPLLTKQYCEAFIDTVKSLDEVFIAKKLHHLVYNLPDGAYFTLRVLIFHLNKVASYESVNRMSPKSLSIIWGPALFNEDTISPQDLGYKSKVVEELMRIANEIFDTDD